MTLEHLQLFRDVAQSRSLSRAAQLNSISQPAVSQRLKELERRFGTPLVDRRKRPLTLTEAGRRFADFCREVLRLRQDFQVELEGLKGTVEGACRVASIYSVGLSELGKLEREFSRRFPDAALAIEYLRPERVYQAVLEDRADLGLVSYPEPRKGLKVTPWREERMVAAASPSHSLANELMLDPRKLAGLDFIGFDDDLPISRDVIRYFREAGVEVNQVVHFDNIQSMKEAVALGTGFSILPEPILHPDIEQGRLVAIPLADPGLLRPLGVLQGKKKQLNRATVSFLSLLMENGT